MAKGKGEVKGWITVNGVHVPIYENYSVRGGAEPKAKGSKFKSAGSKKKKPDLNAIKNYASDSRTATGDPTVIKVGNEEYFKSGDDRWERHSTSGKVLHGTLSDKQMNDIVQKHDGEVTVMEGKKKETSKGDTEGSNKKKIDTSTTSGKTANDLNSNLKKKGLELDSADLSSMAHKDFNDEKVTMYDKEGNTYEGTYNKYKNGDREIVDIKKTSSKEASKGQTEGNKETADKDNKEKPKNFKEGLKQHEGIQKIANDQNEKVWNGGATNQELYDAADKFAESKNFNKDKVRDAAFSAFNEKWWATNKAKQAEKEATKETNFAKHEDYTKNAEQKKKWQDISNALGDYDANEEQVSSKPAATPTSGNFERKKYKVDGNVMKGLKSAKEMTGRSDLTVHELSNDAISTHYAFRDKDGNEVGQFHESHTNKKANYMNLNTSATGDNSKPINRGVPTTVSGLRSAYSEATGSEKAAIASELRKKGYSLVGGKWIKA